MEEMEEATLKMALNRQHISYAYSRKLKQLAMSDIQYLVRNNIMWINQNKFVKFGHENYVFVFVKIFVINMNILLSFITMTCIY